MSGASSSDKNSSVLWLGLDTLRKAVGIPAKFWPFPSPERPNGIDADLRAEEEMIEGYRSLEESANRRFVSRTNPLCLLSFSLFLSSNI